MRENIKKYVVVRKYDFKPLLLIIIAGLISSYYVVTANAWLVSSVSFKLAKPKTSAVIYYERDVTAYNVGIEWQTDDSPCIGASGLNLCELLERGEKVVAANFAPIGSTLHIKGYGYYTVLDRMNSRYPYRVDIAFKASELEQARAFGVKQLDIAIID